MLPTLTREQREVVGLVLIAVFFLTDPFCHALAPAQKTGPQRPV
jgi:hypothetical protein